jgi:hypothetical protein
MCCRAQGDTLSLELTILSEELLTAFLYVWRVTIGIAGESQSCWRVLSEANEDPAELSRVLLVPGSRGSAEGLRELQLAASEVLDMSDYTVLVQYWRTCSCSVRV